GPWIVSQGAEPEDDADEPEERMHADRNAKQLKAQIKLRLVRFMQHALTPGDQSAASAVSSQHPCSQVLPRQCKVSGLQKSPQPRSAGRQARWRRAGSAIFSSSKFR